jgi:hypothetical protein
LFSVSLGSCPVAARVVIAELDAVMHVIANSLYARPSAYDWPELRPATSKSFCVSQYLLP